jgi:LPS O-antigen subunit length determinant protein (WzzB/FepE family)
MTASFRLAAAATLAAGLFAALPASAQTAHAAVAPPAISMRADASAITAALRKRDALAVKQSEFMGRLHAAQPQMQQRLAEMQPRPAPRGRTR